MADPFLGEIRIFAGTFAPQNWKFCDGTLLNISGNEALYNLMGTTYGGDGINTFALPDLRGRVPIHRNDPTYSMGISGGAETVTLTPDNLPPHTHTFQALSTAATGNAPAGQFLAQSDAVAMFTKGAVPQSMAAASVASPAGWTSTPHENMQPFQCINYIIALAGIYPSQG